MRNKDFILRNLALLATLVAAVAGITASRGLGATEPNAAPKKLDPNDPVVTVNDVNISEGQVQAAIKAELDKPQTKLPATPVLQLTKRLRQKVVRRLILDLVLEHQANKAKIQVTEEDVIAHFKAKAAKRQPPLSLEQVKKLIEAKGETFDQAVKRIQKSKSMRYQKLMKVHLAGKINITEQDAKKYYSENPQQFGTPEQVRASHILIEPDAADPNADQARAKARAGAETLLKQINKGGDFAELAKANSADSLSAANGGDLGFKARGQWTEPFDQVAFKLKVGQVSDVVETRFGYHIIKVTDHRDPNLMAFEQARESIISQLAEQKQRDLITEYINELKDKANIIYHDDTFPVSRKITIYPPGQEPDTPDPNHTHTH